MALPRLPLAERRLLLQNQGFLKATRSLSSPSSSSSSSSSLGGSTAASLSKRREAAKEQRAAAVESFVKKYMLMNPGVFPKTKQVQNELGGSWSLLKDILAELKEKMTGDPQVYKQIASTKAYTTVEAASEVAAVKEKNEVGAMVNDPESTVHPLDIHSHQKSMRSIKSHVTAERASEEIAIQEGTKNEKLVEHDDRRQLNSYLSPVVVHESDQNSASLQLSSLIRNMLRNEERRTNASQNGPDLNDAKSNGQKAASQQSSFMVGQAVSNEVETPNASQHGLNLNDAKSSDKTFVENGNLPSDINVYKMPSNERKHTGLVDLFQITKTDAAADEKNTMKSDRDSGSKMATANAFWNKQEITDFIDRIKEVVKLSPPPPRDIFDNSNQHIRNLIKKNGTGAMLERMKLNPDKEQTTLCEPDIYDDIKKPKRGETRGEPLDLVLKNASGRESNFIDHAIICDETGHQENNEEQMKVPFEMFEPQIENEDGSGSDTDFAALDYPSKSVLNIPPPINVLKPRIFLHTEKESPFLGKSKELFRYKLLVKFLQKSATENDIFAAFGHCGPIANIQIVLSRKENSFNYAYINFKTKGGLKKAQTKTDVVICGADVVVEAASLFLRNPVKIPTGPFACPNVPIALLRHPSRTVMVKPLPPDLASYHLRHALSLFGCISGFAMGSSSSIAYVEFETEDAKEKALAMSSISIAGSTLAILRIDAPLTTVVRISNVGFITNDAIQNICNSHGGVKRVVRRDLKTVDVHFMLTEWPNMANIINSLNGLLINQHRWQAQPATVIPAEILQMLWQKPDEWRWVRSFVQSLCRKIEQDSNSTSELTNLATEYHTKHIRPN